MFNILNYNTVRKETPAASEHSVFWLASKDVQAVKIQEALN